MNLTRRRSFGQVNTRFFWRHVYFLFINVYCIILHVNAVNKHTILYYVTVIKFFMGQIQDAQDMSTPCPRHIEYVLYTSGTKIVICIMSGTCPHCPNIVRDMSPTHRRQIPT